ncbi:MAG: cupin domain-containing protein [Candidatus Brocadiales bacterium]|nr:cupin domain-containing protein [Candidatus Bathyanammoxibius sp.]MCQ4574332.1 cupin domain-containing protein [Candidatus Bathyanammoxibius amoris]
MDIIDISGHKGGFFKILQQTEKTQSAVMTFEVGQDSGGEDSHPGDQIIYVVEGRAFVRAGKEEAVAGPGMLLTIPAGVSHYVRNEGDVPLFILTVYAPPSF